MQKTVLVLGGAGYIGSNTAYLLSQKDYNVIILDKLIYNQKFDHNFAKLIIGDFADEKILENIFKTYKIDAVLHFAALIEVGLSVINPVQFYNNNVIKTLKFLDIMLSYNIKKFIFSSSCAVYGNPVQIPIPEEHKYNPISPYGKNKLIIEYALQDYAHAYNLNYISLRYFNAAGTGVIPDTDPGSKPKIFLGEQHIPETHIIPLLLRAIKNNKIFTIFGDNYNTQDGTCVRDYIHVQDLAHAHYLALEYLIGNNNNINNSQVFNLGTGLGYSVKDLILCAQKITGKKANIQICPRREGDVDTLVADNKKIKNTLGWSPEYSSLENIMRSAWEWENRS
ncbi:MAG: UDP-glucose 4-epimerase [candidate division TM6 bacterium GW2011_GWF2_28_16]|nr:MAG: UDP-glucose 4-epimerase [candidate division TM6 bacterium GW2011_GWF2_28_16]